MKGYSTKYIMSPFFDLPSDRAELTKVYRTLAKAADERLVRLEKLAKEENYHNASRYAYARAMRDIAQYSGEDATRFNTKPPESDAALKAKIEDIKHFLSSDTSTKTGIKGVMQKRADTLNKNFGTNFKWDEVGKFFDSKLHDKTAKSYGSKTLVKAIGVMRQNKEKIKEALKEMRRETRFVPKETKQEIKDEIARNMDVPDDQVGNVVRDIVANYGPQVAKYLKSIE